jgi:sulfur-carrier protein adenylyltransferase/sulfurtransferase
VMGTLQATEVIKICLSLGQTISGKLLTYDALSLSFATFEIARDENCAVCGTAPRITELKAEVETCANVTPISAERLYQNKDQFVIVDVRETHEREESSIAGSLHVPLAKILARETHGIPKDKQVVVHCEMGGRSLKAAEHLVKEGYTQILNLTGGIKAWQAFINRR